MAYYTPSRCLSTSVSSWTISFFTNRNLFQFTSSRQCEKKYFLLKKSFLFSLWPLVWRNIKTKLHRNFLFTNIRWIFPIENLQYNPVFGDLPTSESTRTRFYKARDQGHLSRISPHHMKFFDLYSRQQPFINLSSFPLHFSRSTSFVSKLANTVMSLKTRDGRDGKP